MQNNNYDANAKVKLSGLWVKKTKSGESYMSGTLNNGLRINVFKNKYKRSDQDPDYELILTEAKAPQHQQKQQNNSDDIFDPFEDTDDSLPF